jgi:hypothetical protein
VGRFAPLLTSSTRLLLFAVCSLPFSFIFAFYPLPFVF